MTFNRKQANRFHVDATYGQTYLLIDAMINLNHSRNVKKSRVRRCTPDTHQGCTRVRSGMRHYHLDNEFPCTLCQIEVTTRNMSLLLPLKHNLRCNKTRTFKRPAFQAYLGLRS